MMDKVCNFVRCTEKVTVLVTYRSECGHTRYDEVPVCSKHAAPAKSPKAHTCPTCGQRVHMLREP